MIRLQNISKKYGSTVIFDNASFDFPDKGLVCVLGPSGCGKSTLLNLLAGFDSQYDGTVSVHGTSISEMDTQELCAYRRDNVGFVFQNYHLLSGYTAMENILLAAEAAGKSMEESKPKAKELLEKFGLLAKTEQKIETLSGGQKQRIAIARALVNDPSILFADEPTGALDRKNSSEIMELLKELSRTRLVLVITHDKKCAEYADRIVTLSDGKVVCDEQTRDGLLNDDLADKEADAQPTETAVLRKEAAPKLPLWKRAFKNFNVHLPRYMAVALAISFGVVCFALSLSSGNLMEQSIREFEEKNTAYHNGYIKADGKESELLELLRKDNRLENIYAQYVLSDVYVAFGEQDVTMAEKIAEKYPVAKATEQMSYGVMPRRGENEIALSPSLASKFDKDIQSLIGKTVEVSHGGQGYEVTVSGIFNATYDDFVVSSDIEQMMYEGVSGDAYSISYDVVEFEKIGVVSEELKAQGINSRNAGAEVSTFLTTFENLNRLFLTISILIFAIGIFISTILLVKQQNTRYREVGLLSALGYTRGKISSILFAENLALSVLSVLCSGILLAAVLLISSLPGVSLVFSAIQIVITLVLTAVLILALSFAASVKLINTEPAEALRK